MENNQKWALSEDNLLSELRTQKTGLSSMDAKLRLANQGTLILIFSILLGHMFMHNLRNIFSLKNIN